MSDGNFDPKTVAIRPAATVMLLDDRPELHVLMLKRTAKVVFAPAMWVFPGGRVDAEDHADDFDTMFTGLTDGEASRRLGIDHGGLAYWLAACRETLEEAGLLLAATRGQDVDSKTWQDEVRADESSFPDMLLEAAVKLDATALEEVARFVTPIGAPRRFDARFFAAQMPEGQEPRHDDHEIVDWEWVRPCVGLRRWADGDFDMMTPTIRMLACLDRYPNAAAVMSAARRRLSYQRVRVVEPEGEYRVVLPGEDGYETADESVEHGWVRLWEQATNP